MLDQRAETQWNSISWKCPDDVSNAVHYWRLSCISEHESSTPKLLISDGYELLWGTLFLATKKNQRCQTSGVGGWGAGVQTHPQKFWFVENPAKIPENVGKKSENLGKIAENPNKIPKHLGKILENLGKMAPNVVWLQKMAPKVCRKTNEDHFLEVTPQKRSAKVARQLFWQVWENLGKNPLHPQEFTCSCTFVSNDQQWVNNVLVHWHFCVSKVL